MIFFTCSLVRLKSSARISSLSWVKMEPSMRSRLNRDTTSSDRPMKRRHDDTSSTESAHSSDGGRHSSGCPPVTPLAPPSAPLIGSASGAGVGVGEGLALRLSVATPGHLIRRGDGLGVDDRTDPRSTAQGSSGSTERAGLVTSDARSEGPGEGVRVAVSHSAGEEEADVDGGPWPGLANGLRAPKGAKRLCETGRGLEQLE